MRKSGKIYRKSTKFWVSTYQYFGIQVELLDEIEAKGYEHVTFVVKDDLVDFRKIHAFALHSFHFLGFPV